MSRVTASLDIPSMAGVTPTCLALVLCKQVVRHPRTGEPAVMHAFEFFEAGSLPIAIEPFTIWMQLRNGNGPTTMELAIEYVPTERLDPEVVLAVRFRLDFTDPNTVLEHEAVFDNGLHLDRFGRYRLLLKANDTLIIQRYFGAYPRRE